MIQNISAHHLIFSVWGDRNTANFDEQRLLLSEYLIIPYQASLARLSVWEVFGTVI
jgi:hypothetical protein